MEESKEPRTDSLMGEEIANRVRSLLAYYLEPLKEAQLKEFQLWLSNSPHLGSISGAMPAQPEKLSASEVASCLVALHGEQQAWDLACKTWKQMGLSVPCFEAQEKVALTSTEFPSTLSPSSTRNKVPPTLLTSPKPKFCSFECLEHPLNKKRKSFNQLLDTSEHSRQDTTGRYEKQKEKPCFTQSWKKENLGQKFTQLILLQKYHSNQTSWHKTTIPATQNTKPRGSQVQSQPGQFSKTLCENKTIKKLGTRHSSTDHQFYHQCDQNNKKQEKTPEHMRHDLRGQEPPLNKSWFHNAVKKQGHLIEIQDLFGPGPGAQEEPRTVILHGAAGIGKSTLARQVRGAWEESWLYRDRFRYVFYFSCRELAGCEVMSLAELIARDWGDSAAPIEQVLSRPEQLLFILDGVDEPKWVLEDQHVEFCLHWSQPLPVPALLGSLLRKTVLPGASFLITTRTTAVQKFIPSLAQPRWVEILGFSESGRKDYFYKYFEDRQQAIRAFGLLESNPALLTLSLVPWVCWLVCTCLKQQMDWGEARPLTPQTPTALCLHYLSQALSTQDLRPPLRSLCSLAAEGVWQRKTLFSACDLKSHQLDEAVIATFLKMSVLQKHSGSLTCSFTHRCFQEFFAAVSWALRAEEEGSEPPGKLKVMEKLLDAYGRDDLFGAPTVRFLFGLLSDQGAGVLENIFACRLPAKWKWQLLQWAQTKDLGPPYSLDFIHCLYETQDEELLKSAMAHFQGTRICIQTNVELLVFTFCVKFCSHVKQLQLHDGGHQRQALWPPEVVRSRWAPLTDANWRVFFSIFGETENLKELDLSGNPLSLPALQYLCESLRHPRCHLETLRLVGCSLTHSCCRDLATVLSTSPSLKELDLQQNDLGSHGVQQLLAGLRHPGCHLTLLWLDHILQSEVMSTELEALAEEKPQLRICSRWNPSMTISTKEPDGREMENSTSSRQQTSQSGTQHTEPLGDENNFWGPTGPVPIEVVDQERGLYRVHFLMEGVYQCLSMGLSFTVRREVTIEMEFCAWDQFLHENNLQHTWMVAGPLFDIRAEQGAVAVIHLPHFVAIQGGQVNTSSFHVAHFKKEGMLLEKPSRVESHYIVLENPSFSPMGILLRMIPTARRFVPINSTTLLYHQLHPEEVKFHLYLVPSDCTIRKAIDDEEKKFQFVRIHKPPPLDPFYIGSRYTVSGSQNLEIIPKELELCYRSPRESQLFSEISVDNFSSRIQLQIGNKDGSKIVWEALLKPGDLRPAATLVSPASAHTLPVLHFVDQYREQLVARVTMVDMVLDKLHGCVLSEEQYESVRTEATRPDQMRKLFSFSRAWDRESKCHLYRALKETHQHLIMDLWEDWGRSKRLDSSAVHL